MIFTKATDRSTFSIREAAQRGAYSFADNYSSSVRMFNALNASDGQGYVLNEIWSPIVERVNEVAEENGLEIPDNPYLSSASDFLDIDIMETLSGPERSTAFSYKKQIVNPGAQLQNFSSIDILNQVKDDEKYKVSQQIIFDFIKQHQDLFPEFKDLTDKKIFENAKALALEIQSDATEISELSPGFNSGFARFLGTAEGAITDPKIMASLVPSVAVSFVPGVNIYGLAVTEGIIAAGTEVFIQEDVKEWYEELGLDYTPEQFRNAVITAGFSATGATYFLHIAGKTIQLTLGQMKKGYKAFKEAGVYKNNPVQEQRDNALERITEQNKAATIYEGLDPDNLSNTPAYTEFSTKINAVANGQPIPVNPQNKIAPEALDDFTKEVSTKTITISQVAKINDKNIDLDLSIVKETNKLKKEENIVSPTWEASFYNFEKATKIIENNPKILKISDKEWDKYSPFNPDSNKNMKDFGIFDDDTFIDVGRLRQQAIPKNKQIDTSTKPINQLAKSLQTQNEIPEKLNLGKLKAEAEKDVTTVYTEAHQAKETAIRKNVGDDAADVYQSAGMAKANKLAEKRQGKGPGLGNPRGRLDDATVTVRQVELKDVNLDNFDDPIEGMDSNLEALKAEALENVGGDITKEVDIPLETVGDEVTVEVTSLGKLQKSFEEEDALEKAVSGCA